MDWVVIARQAWWFVVPCDQLIVLKRWVYMCYVYIYVCVLYPSGPISLTTFQHPKEMIIIETNYRVVKRANLNNSTSVNGLDYHLFWMLTCDASGYRGQMDIFMHTYETSHQYIPSHAVYILLASGQRFTVWGKMWSHREIRYA